MHIAVLGAGKIGELLGRYWAGNNHDIFVGSRDPERAAAAAGRIGSNALAGTYAQAIADAAVVLLALTPFVVEAVVREHAHDLDGKILIDCNNRHYPGGVGTYPAFEPPSLAERILAAAPGAHVAKAFASIGSGRLETVLRKNAPVVDGHRTSIFYCASDQVAGAGTRGLIEELNLDAVDCGDLGQAFYLETIGALAMWLADNRFGEDFSFDLARKAQRDEASPLDRWM